VPDLEATVAGELAPEPAGELVRSASSD